MTREESLSITEAIEDYVCNYVTDTAKAQKMLNAIQTLEQEPCEDAISRQAVLETLDDMDNVVDEDRTIENYKELLKECYEVLPPVNPQEPKTGHWIAQNIHNCHTDFKCSECGYIHNFTHLYGEPTADYTYCPNCGAKMVEEQERSE